MKRTTLIPLLILMVLPAVAFTASKKNKPEKMDHAKKDMPASFKALEALVGTWEGTAKETNKEDKVKATYELTSGGTALMEKLFANTSGEMVSIYHSKGDKLRMTHYCSLGNSPMMELKHSDTKTYEFKLKGDRGIQSVKEPHMHGLKLTLIDANTLKQEWSYYEGGKQKDTTTILLKRVE